MRSAYEVLGVPRDAGLDEIRRAYRSRALQYHPDRNRGSREAEERFKELAEAFRAVGDPQRRAVYDLYGPDGLARMAGFDPEAPDLAAAIELFVEQFSALVQDDDRDAWASEPAMGAAPGMRSAGTVPAGSAPGSADRRVAAQTEPARARAAPADRAVAPPPPGAAGNPPVAPPLPEGDPGEAGRAGGGASGSGSRGHTGRDPAASGPTQPPAPRPVAAVAVSAAVAFLGGAILFGLPWALRAARGDGTGAGPEAALAIVLASAAALALAFVASFLLARVQPALDAAIADARRGLAVVSRGLGRGMRSAELRMRRFLHRERRQAARPLVVQLERLAAAVEDAGARHVAALARIETRLAGDVERLRGIQPPAAWGPEPAAARFRARARKAGDGIVTIAVLLLMAAGLGAINVWALQAALPMLESEAMSFTLPLLSVDLAGLLPLVVTMAALGSGVLAQALERMDDDRRPHAALVLAGPYLMVFAILVIQILAFLGLATSGDLAATLGFPADQEISAAVAFFVVFAGAVIAVALVGVGAGVWLHLRQFLAARADRRMMRRLERYAKRMESQSGELEAVRKRIRELGDLLEGLSAGLAQGFVHTTGLDPSDRTLAGGVREMAVRLAETGSLPARPTPRSRDDVLGGLAVGAFGFTTLAVLVYLLYRTLAAGFTGSGLAGFVQPGALAAAGATGMALAGYVFKDAIYGSNHAATLLMSIPDRRGRTAIAALAAAAALLGAVFSGWLAVQGNVWDAAATFGFAFTVLLTLAVTFVSFNLDGWLVSVAKLATVAGAGSVWLALGTTRAALAVLDAFLATAGHLLRIAAIPGSRAGARPLRSG